MNKKKSGIRLTDKEEIALQESFNHLLAPLGDVKVYLFGSRIKLKKAEI